MTLSARRQEGVIYRSSTWWWSDPPIKKWSLWSKRQLYTSSVQDNKDPALYSRCCVASFPPNQPQDLDLKTSAIYQSHSLRFLSATRYSTLFSACILPPLDINPRRTIIILSTSFHWWLGDQMQRLTAYQLIMQKMIGFFLLYEWYKKRGIIKRKLFLSGASISGGFFQQLYAKGRMTAFNQPLYLLQSTFIFSTISLQLNTKQMLSSLLWFTAYLASPPSCLFLHSTRFPRSRGVKSMVIECLVENVCPFSIPFHMKTYLSFVILI